MPAGTPYDRGMSSHTLADAEHHLSDLIDRALAGEGVVITRDGRPVVRLEPVAPHREGRRMTREDIEWVERRTTWPTSRGEDLTAYLRTIRDEERG